jgi:hypothetical protein
MSPPYPQKKLASATPRAKATDNPSLRQPARAASDDGFQAALARDAAATWTNLQHLLLIQDSALEDRAPAQSG